MVQHTQQNKHKQNWNLDGIIILNYGSTMKEKCMSTDLVTTIKLIRSPLHMSIKRSHKENDPARRR